MRISIMILMMLSTLLFGEDREALLIGNSNYKYISTLDDPSSNLNKLKKVLKGLEFNVEIKKDLNSENLEEAIERFVSRLSKNRESVGFLYYTGHGCQVDYQGYLIPVDLDTKKRLKIKYNALNINKMLESISDANNRVNMVFLDACRDVPTGAKGASKGLGQPTNTPNGSLIVYATKAGEVAEDNSYFLDAIVKNLRKTNQNIRDMGDNISLSVAKKSAYHQIPVVYSMLLPKMVLNSKSKSEEKHCTKLIVIPAVYKSVTKRVRVTKGGYKKVPVPAKYKFSIEKIKVHDAYRVYSWVENGTKITLKPKVKIVTKRFKITNGTERYIKVKGRWKKITRPPLYKTIKITKVIKKVNILDVSISGNYTSYTVPAKYKTLKKKILIKEAKLKRIFTPATYKKVTTKVLVTPEKKKRISISCD
jgi:hypothetical protein